MESLANFWTRIEVTLAALLIGLSLLHAGQTMGGMLTTSLSTDEFGTIGTFSSKGPVRVVTDYRAPKNHIFFNLLNSVLPARESLHPSRARALSVLATIFTAGAVIAYATYRRQLMEGAVLIALWCTAPFMLSLSMEARGYGFLGLFAILATIATIEFLRSRHTAWLWALAISSVLGVYTIPGYLFFAGSLMVILWSVDRTRRTFFFGAGAGVAMLVLYLPVLGQLLAAFHESQGERENDFVSPSGVVRALKLYLLPCEDWQGWLFLAAMAAAPFVLPLRQDARDGIGRRIVVAACLAFFAILLVLQAPPVRVSAFAILPLALAGFLSIGVWLRGLPVGFRALSFAAVAVLLTVAVTKSILWSRFTPSEDWLLAGRAIDTAFPDDTKVEFRRFAKYLKQTLTDSGKRSADYDETSLADGSLIVADASNKWAEGRRFVPPAGIARLMEWTVPGTIRDVVMTFSLPAGWSVDSAPEKVSDGDFSSGVSIAPDDVTFTVQIPENAKALVLLLNRPVVHRDLLVQMTTGEEKKNLTDDVLLAGNGIILPATALANTKIDIRLATLHPDLQLLEAWIAK